MNPADTAHILYVDDDANCLRGFERTLRKLRPQYALSLADNPQDALRRFQSDEFDLLVTDIQMPVMTGIDLLRETGRSRPSVPSMILSGVADLPVALTAINELQVFRLLTKPCPPQCLVDSIDAALAGAKGQSASQTGQAMAREDLRLDLAFDLITIGLIVIDEQGRVHHSNRHANALIGENDGLLVTPAGILKASTPADTEVLMRCVECALDGEAANADNANVVRICRNPMKRDLSVFVAAVPAADPEHVANQMVALFILDPDQHSAPSPDIVADMFGLTLSEATIVCHLILGETIQTAAERSGVTLSTARTYLKRVFGKTATTKQSELISLVLRSTFGMTANTPFALEGAD